MRIASLALFLLLSSFSFAWWDPSFQYRSAINISNPGSALTDYQVQVNPSIYNDTGLVGSWHFSEGSGTRAADSSGLGNDGTLNGFDWTATSNWTQGKFGNGLLFDGTGDYVEVADADSLDFSTADFALSIWFKAASGTYAQHASILTKQNPELATGWAFQIETVPNGNLYFRANAIGQLRSEANYFDDTWHYAVVTRAGGTLYLFVDGVQRNSTTVSLSLTNGDPLRIGRRSSSYNGYFKGIIDEVRIYNRSLSAQEVQAHYNASKARLDYADLRFTQPYAVYETPISISGTGSTLTDYQVLVNITDSTVLSHMRSDGADLRLFPSATSTPYSSTGLAYWIESINSTQARVWVKANISSGGSTIYLYYGNVSASAQSNGSKVFEFFDDFEDGTIGGQWATSRSASASTSSESGGKLVVSSSGDEIYYIRGISASTPANTIMEVSLTNIAVPAVDYAGIGIGFIGQPVSWGASFLFISRFYDAGQLLRTKSNNIVRKDTVTSIASANLKLVKNGTDFKSYIDNALEAAWTDSSFTYSAMYYALWLHHNTGGAQALSASYDNFRVRKYSATEPSASLGSESIKSSGNEASLPFWLESDIAAWVKVPSLPAGIGSIYSYYGSPSASPVSNGSATFDFFDDFSGASLDSSKWDSVTGPSGGSVSVGSGALSVSSLATLNTGGRVRSKTAFTLPYVYRVRARDDVVQGYMFSSWGISDANTVFAISTGNDIFGTNSLTISHSYTNAYTCNAGTCSYNALTRDTSWHVYNVYGTSSSVKYYQDSALKGTVTTNIPSMPLNFTVKTMTHDASAPASAWNTMVDYLFIRKYSSSEPSASGGVEQQSDVTPPAVSIQSPANATYSSTALSLNFTASDASGVSACKYSLNGAANVSLPGCANASVTAQSGPNSLVVWASDGSNWGSASVSFTVQLDITPPGISISSPANVSYSSGSVPVAFVVSDDVAVSSCAVRLNGSLNSSSCGNYSLSLGNGAYLLNITANDTSGNVNSTSVSFSVSIPVSVSKLSSVM